MLNVCNIKVFKNRFYSVGLVFIPIVFLSWVKGKDSYASYFKVAAKFCYNP